MNEILQNIMLFINEHTLLLIGICVFLILVLIGYLIDNSVKSKRVRNDIKNADQVPENIKEEIIKKAEEKAIKKEDAPLVNNNENVTVEPTVNNDVNNVNQVVNNPTNELSGELNLDSTNITNNISDNNNQELVLDTPNMKDELVLDANIQSPFNLDIQEDPDAKIMSSVNEYSNDRSLSDILNNVKEEVVTNNVEIDNSTSIFGDNSTDIVINNDVKKDDVQIENNNSSDELDRIMRKLSTMNNNVEDDNYTNIF